MSFLTGRFELRTLSPFFLNNKQKLHTGHKIKHCAWRIINI